MKKLILVAVIIVLASFTSYTKNKLVKLITPAKTSALTDDNRKISLGYAYNSRLDIGQADGNN